MKLNYVFSPVGILHDAPEMPAAPPFVCLFSVAVAAVRLFYCSRCEPFFSPFWLICMLNFLIFHTSYNQANNNKQFVNAKLTKKEQQTPTTTKNIYKKKATDMKESAKTTGTRWVFASTAKWRCGDEACSCCVAVSNTVSDLTLFAYLLCVPKWHKKQSGT